MLIIKVTFTSIKQCTDNVIFTYFVYREGQLHGQAVMEVGSCNNINYYCNLVVCLFSFCW